MRAVFLSLAALMLMLSAAGAQEHAAATGAIASEAAPVEAAPVDAAPPPDGMTVDHAASEPGPVEHAATDHAAADHAAAAAHAAADHAATDHAATDHAAAAHGEGGHDEGGHGAGENYLPKIVNFIIFASILVFVARKPIAAFFGGRRKDIDESFTKAEAAQRDVATKVAEMQERLAALDVQVKDILARAQDQAEAERQAILETARAGAQKLLTQAEAQVADLEAASVRRLKAMAADLAVDGARELIEKQLGADDRKRLFDRTLKGLSKASTQ